MPRTNRLAERFQKALDDKDEDYGTAVAVVAWPGAGTAVAADFRLSCAGAAKQVWEFLQCFRPAFRIWSLLPAN